MRSYCIHSCVPIFHGRGDDPKNDHAHSLEIAAYIHRASDQFEAFSAIEGKIEAYLNRYANQHLNFMPDFEGDASIEHISEVFFFGLLKHLEENGLELERLEVAETPLRVCAIGLSDRASDPEL